MKRSETIKKLSKVIKDFEEENEFWTYEEKAEKFLTALETLGMEPPKVVTTDYYEDFVGDMQVRCSSLSHWENE